MADKTFDAIIVGGGNKALITAMYLTKYGNMEVGIFEDRHELGGGWSCEEPSPGFAANTCSSEHMAWYHLPVYRDFPEWRDYGARYAYTKVSLGAVYEEDDSCCLMYNAFLDVDPTQEKTASEFARFSKKDGDTYLKLWEKCQKYWRPAFDEWLFSPVKPFGEPDALDKLVQNPEAGLEPLWFFQTPVQTYNDIFESLEVKNAFTRTQQSYGFPMDAHGLGALAILSLIYAWPYHNYVKGGTHALTHASHKVIIENGGMVYTNAKTEKILIENGKARGIRLADGTEVNARHMVISTVDPYQLCFELIGKEHFSPQVVNRVKHLDRSWITIAWYTWSLKEPLRYKAESFNPDVKECMTLFPTVKNLDMMVKESWERRMGMWPSEVNLSVCHHFGDDDLIGPPNNDYTLLTEQFVLPADALTEQEWKEKEGRISEDIVKTLQRYAPNMTWDNVTGCCPVTPFYTAKTKNYAPAGNWAVIDHTPPQLGRLRPIPEWAGHRIGIDNFYATGSAWPPFASAHSAQGYNCYKVIAEDKDLKKPWEEKGDKY